MTAAQPRACNVASLGAAASAGYCASWVWTRIADDCGLLMQAIEAVAVQFYAVKISPVGCIRLARALQNTNWLSSSFDAPSAVGE
jgi:hypothetical protein